MGYSPLPKSINLFFLNTNVNQDDHQKLAQAVKVVSIIPGGRYALPY